jgi:hypothetical protein
MSNVYLDTAAVVLCKYAQIISALAKCPTVTRTRKYCTYLVAVCKLSDIVVRRRRCDRALYTNEVNNASVAITQRCYKELIVEGCAISL